ncbi:MAG: hypothetical protein LBS46_08540 [Dysgonamonadaceae bacterium]|jgi:hypothetical protein|nr:hypothetical protein [Dysgonamonadaceae bacterium]
MKTNQQNRILCEHPAREPDFDFRLVRKEWPDAGWGEKIPVNIRLQGASYNEGEALTRRSSGEYRILTANELQYGSNGGSSTRTINYIVTNWLTPTTNKSGTCFRLFNLKETVSKVMANCEE